MFWFLLNKHKYLFYATWQIFKYMDGMEHLIEAGTLTHLRTHASQELWQTECRQKPCKLSIHKVSICELSVHQVSASKVLGSRKKIIKIYSGGKYCRTMPEIYYSGSKPYINHICMLKQYLSTLDSSFRSYRTKKPGGRVGRNIGHPLAAGTSLLWVQIPASDLWIFL